MTNTTLSRRTLLAASAGILPATMMGSRTFAQTPIASPDPNGDAIALYAELRDELLTEGRRLVEAFVAGDDAAFSSAAAGGAVSELSASAEMAALQSNRVRIRWPEIGLLLDGHFDGSAAMTGFFYQGSPATFDLAADDDQGGEVPAGRWTGVIGSGLIDLGFALTFSGGADDLAATLDIPDQGLTGFPLPEVTFHPELSLGELIQDGAFPIGPHNHTYAAEYAWGDALIEIGATRTVESGFDTLTIVTRNPLPPDPADGQGSAGRYRLPADGQMIVFWGGPTEFQNYHASSPPQRHALDIVAWDDGSTYRTDGMTNDDYLIWGWPMLAPAAGTVVAAANDYPDIPPAIAAGMQADAATPVSATPVTVEPPHPAGNHVVIEAGGGQFVFLAHMQQGSVMVAAGDAVEAGQQVGLIGNSGNTSEPHIHIHAQNTPDLFDPAAFGIPMSFEDILVDGELASKATPVQGEFIEQA